MLAANFTAPLSNRHRRRLIPRGALAEEVGFPKGVINILTGAAGEIGDEICANPRLKKITFTGSTEVGKILIQKSSVTVKKVSMNGGNAPFIVFDDADIERAIAARITAKYAILARLACAPTASWFRPAFMTSSWKRQRAEGSVPASRTACSRDRDFLTRRRCKRSRN